MPSGCCSNCRTKYSLFNPENGCSSCAFSFCSNCVGYKALLPRLADKPVSVCYTCYQKLNNQKIHQSNQPVVLPTKVQPPPEIDQREPEQDPSVSAFEKRLAALKQRDSENLNHVPTIEEIENRLAALRECDVELIRNPRAWFDTSTSQVNGNDPLELLRNTKARVQLDETYNPDNVLQRRYDELRGENAKEPDNVDPEARMSTISGATEFSEATKEELEQINRLMSDAKKCVDATNHQLKDEAAVEKELQNVMANARQKSLEMDQTNNRVQKEISNFWENQIRRQTAVEESDEEVDDEMVRKIVAEAEATPDEPIPPPHGSTSPHKKKNFFNKLFKR